MFINYKPVFSTIHHNAGNWDHCSLHPLLGLSMFAFLPFLPFLPFPSCSPFSPCVAQRDKIVTITWHLISLYIQTISTNNMSFLSFMLLFTSRFFPFLPVFPVGWTGANGLGGNRVLWNMQVLWLCTYSNMSFYVLLYWLHIDVLIFFFSLPPYWMYSGEVEYVEKTMYMYIIV